MEKAAAAVKAKTLIIVSPDDHTVSPDAALDFADLIHAQVIKLGGDCGHESSACESAQVNSALAQFLAQ